MKRLILIAIASTALTACNSLEDVSDSGAFDCDVYCNMMADNCDLVFRGDRDKCLDVCDEYDFKPQFDDDGDVIPYGSQVDNDDSFECRIYHLDTALKDNVSNNSHCEEASPTGAGTCVNQEDDPECTVLCHGAIYGCDLQREDYLNCVEDCEGRTQVVRDSAEFQTCRRMLADGARNTKNNRNEDANDSVCSFVREVFVENKPCITVVGDTVNPASDMTN